MKKVFLKGALLALAGVGLMAGNAMATLVLPGSETSLNQIFSNKGWSIDSNADQITNDTYWTLSEPDTGAWASMIIEIAGNANTNTFGIYDTLGTEVELMGGAANAGDKVAFTLTNNLLSGVFFDNNTPVSMFSNIAFSSVFGFYLGSGNNKFYSDFTKNNNSNDHMVSYAGTGSNGLSVGHHIIAFEDMYGLGDQDYNDMVLIRICAAYP